MRPFKLRIDWTCWEHRDHPAYRGSKVEVWLHVLGEDWVEEEPRLLRSFDTPLEASLWAQEWFAGRGIGFLCDTYNHWRSGHTHVTLHACPLMSIGTGQPLFEDSTGALRPWPDT